MREPTAAHERNSYQRRSATVWAALTLGVPLAAGILYLVHAGPLPENEVLREWCELARRYLKHHVEGAEVVLFCCALAAFAAKLWAFRREKSALRAAGRNEIVPAWDGQIVPVEEADKLLTGLARLPRPLRNTYLVCRLAAVLDFLRGRKSAHDLDDQLRTLADNDAMALEGSYSLTRFITWAIPILGFLGTVLGITGAITGITPDRLEKDLSTVTDGLALAFDATALGLALTMITMFLSFLVERAEQGVLEAVDLFVDQQLAHRFERLGSDESKYIAVVRRNTDVLLRATETLVQKQAEVWAKTFAQVEERRSEAEARLQQRFSASLESALEKTLETHTRRLAALEKQAVDRGAGLLEKMTALANALRDAGRGQEAALTAALTPLTRGLAAQVEMLARLQEGEKKLQVLPEVLSQNLASAVDAAVQRLQHLEFRVSAPELRMHLEAQQPGPNIRSCKAGKAA